MKRKRQSSDDRKVPDRQQTERERYRERKIQREKDTERERYRERKRQREKETDRERDRERKRQREKETEREGERKRKKKEACEGRHNCAHTEQVKKQNYAKKRTAAICLLYASVLGEQTSVPHDTLKKKMTEIRHLYLSNYYLSLSKLHLCGPKGIRILESLAYIYTYPTIS
jgi:hypothetical protein